MLVHQEDAPLVTSLHQTFHLHLVGKQWYYVCCHGMKHLKVACTHTLIAILGDKWAIEGETGGAYGMQNV